MTTLKIRFLIHSGVCSGVFFFGIGAQLNDFLITYWSRGLKQIRTLRLFMRELFHLLDKHWGRLKITDWFTLLFNSCIFYWVALLNTAHLFSKLLMSHSSPFFPLLSSSGFISTSLFISSHFILPYPFTSFSSHLLISFSFQFFILLLILMLNFFFISALLLFLWCIIIFHCFIWRYM